MIKYFQNTWTFAVLDWVQSDETIEHKIFHRQLPQMWIQFPPVGHRQWTMNRNGMEPRRQWVTKQQRQWNQTDIPALILTCLFSFRKRVRDQSSFSIFHARRRFYSPSIRPRLQSFHPSPSPLLPPPFVRPRLFREARLNAGLAANAPSALRWIRNEPLRRGDTTWLNPTPSSRERVLLSEVMNFVENDRSFAWHVPFLASPLLVESYETLSPTAVIVHALSDRIKLFVELHVSLTSVEVSLSLSLSLSLFFFLYRCCVVGFDRDRWKGEKRHCRTRWKIVSVERSFWGYGLSLWCDDCCTRM